MMLRTSAKHPDDRALHRLFDDVLEGAERMAVQSHLERCARCGSRRDALARQSSDVRAEPVPAYAPDVLARVLARRDSGERGLPARWPTDAVPDAAEVLRSRAERSESRWRGRVAAGLAAAMLLAAGLAAFDASDARTASIHGAAPCAALPSNPEDTMPAHSLRRFVAALYGIPLAWVGGCATDVPAGPAIAPSEIDGTRLVPMTLEYGTSHWVDDLAPTRQPGTMRLELRPASWQSRPAWVVIDHQRPAPGRLAEGASADSLFLDRRDLSLLGAVRTAPRMSYRVHRDSGYVRFRIAAPGQPVRAWEDAIDAGVRARSPLFLPVAFGALPIGSGWRATVETMDVRASWGIYSGRPLADGRRVVGRSTTSLQVVGSERITVPAGSFDAWRVRAQTRHEVTGYAEHREPPELLWVSRKEGLLLRIKRTRVEGDTRYTTVTELTRVERE